MLLISLALAAAQPTAKPPSRPSVPAATPGTAARPNMPAPDAERLALADTLVAKMLPPGSYARMMTDMMGGSMDSAMSAMLDMTTEEMAGTAGKEEGEDSEKSESMRETIAREDPHFEERMKIMSRVMGEEFGRLSGKLEPRLREGLARSLARRFSLAELKDISGFFATPSGGKFAAETLMIWADPEMMQSMMAGMPEIMAEMPAIMKKVEAATAHLPPPKKESAKPAEQPTS